MIFGNHKRNFKKSTFASNKVELSKPNTKVRRILLFFEIILVALVLAGTTFGLVRVFEFSPVQFFEKNLSHLVPKNPVDTSKAKPKDKQGILIESLPEEVFAFKEKKAETKDYVSLVSKQGTTAIFSLSKDLDEQLATLQNLLIKAKINNKKVEKLDLRFDKIIVVYGK
ncbi:hypothetical protein IID23_01910 [Patescibacteria group bacterium]|nr:hypothetical protein [Patescibacteria group bacterium]